ncbi:hypothetical protein SB768_33150, partial [Burkholderia sp. SIMBA_043]|uniref:hypothetical protein n=1 Tax=Burkholderia sp. SIMBA_043 TaxID=3085784 RepID=UPI00397832E9
MASDSALAASQRCGCSMLVSLRDPGANQLVRESVAAMPRNAYSGIWRSGFACAKERASQRGGRAAICPAVRRNA